MNAMLRRQPAGGPSGINTTWTQGWTAAGLAPRSPAETLRWRERLDDILARLGKRSRSGLLASIGAGGEFQSGKTR